MKNSKTCNPDTLEDSRRGQVSDRDYFIGEGEHVKPCAFAFLLVPRFEDRAAYLNLWHRLKDFDSISSLWSYTFPEDCPGTVAVGSIERLWFDKTMEIRNSHLKRNDSGQILFWDAVNWAVKKGLDLPPEWVEKARNYDYGDNLEVEQIAKVASANWQANDAHIRFSVHLTDDSIRKVELKRANKNGKLLFALCASHPNPLHLGEILDAVNGDGAAIAWTRKEGPERLSESRRIYSLVRDLAKQLENKGIPSSVLPLIACDPIDVRCSLQLPRLGMDKL